MWVVSVLECVCHCTASHHGERGFDLPKPIGWTGGRKKNYDCKTALVGQYTYMQLNLKRTLSRGPETGGNHRYLLYASDAYD